MKEIAKKIIAFYVAMKNFTEDGELPKNWHFEFGRTLYKLEVCDFLNVLITARPTHTITGDVATPITNKSAHYGTEFVSLNDEECELLYDEECSKIREMFDNEIATINWRMNLVMEQSDIDKMIENGKNNKPINVYWR